MKAMGSIGAVILAAGLSRRMGEPKLFLPYRGRPLFLQTVETAVLSGLDPIVLVVGEHEEGFRELVSFPQVTILKNEEYSTGMGSSLRAGFKHMEGKAAASFVFLADQPFVPLPVPQEIIKRYRQERSNGYLIFQPKYMEQAGHPILFDAGLFHEFRELQGDIGGREIIRKYRDQCMPVHFRNESWGIDIDTPDDYEQALKLESRKLKGDAAE
ncbi:nucleotidyltransferase family protein [Ferviditalea candida]|uniref:Nucleotidyltransferase family protein n=1 Tax=Ferviditalea candida TaxID=3108399 RepID=A0ABU5ZM67_9BACL|nr:nucleotidyltransferase family protein [Paenibacillaceae bacterium T2]